MATALAWFWFVLWVLAVAWGVYLMWINDQLRHELRQVRAGALRTVLRAGDGPIVPAQRRAGDR